jgi:hypothetical protein
MELSATLSRIPFGRGRWEMRMKKYSIVRIGHEYVVRADNKNILKVSSRRRAAKLVTDAELLDAQPASPVRAGTQARSSIVRDPKVIPDPFEVS